MGEPVTGTTTAPPGRSRACVRSLVAMVVFAVVVAVLPGTAGAQTPSRPGDPRTAEVEFFNLLNGERAKVGLAPLVWTDNLVRDARRWSSVMAPTGSIFHTTTLAADTAASVPSWRRAGENVGMGWSVGALHHAFVNSSGHYANIVGDFNMLGVGVVYTESRTFVTFRFAKGTVSTTAATSGSTTPVVSAEVAGAQVRRLYLAYFRREPDQSGRDYWTAKLTAGLPLWQVSAEFARSAEFRSTYGSLGNADFVRLVYSNVLGREPDAGGFAHWTGKLAEGRSRGWVMVSFSESREFVAKAG